MTKVLESNEQKEKRTDCYQCPDRWVGEDPETGKAMTCHSSCEVYLTNRKLRDELKERIKKERQAEAYPTSFRKNAKQSQSRSF